MMAIVHFVHPGIEAVDLRTLILDQVMCQEHYFDILRYALLGQAQHWDKGCAALKYAEKFEMDPGDRCYIELYSESFILNFSL